ncbi:putative transmembrane protein [Candidatus Burkholderia brachyanthoides]|nr:putative transmembrane protein [Candidatus Burkholderia brachyanthoides]
MVYSIDTKRLGARAKRRSSWFVVLLGIGPGACVDASAHVTVGIGFGYAPPVYVAPPPVYYAPLPPSPPVYYAPPPAAVIYQPSPPPIIYGEDWREHEWRQYRAYERWHAYYGY